MIPSSFGRFLESAALEDNSPFYLPSIIRGSSGGQPRVGFGTVTDHVNDPKHDYKSWVESEFFHEAPTAWDGEDFTQSDSEHKGPVFKNSQDFQIDIVLGTCEVLKDDALFRPFLRIKNIGPGETYKANTDLYIHAFITRGYNGGQYGSNLLEDIWGDMLTDRGIRFTSLRPITYWHITKVGGKYKVKYHRWYLQPTCQKLQKQDVYGPRLYDRV
ncbi:hypothetical protein BYT27DRAFT_6397878 [Phlegmacium glaucopus]|nr:hypothetical protein BYT27DRAFT_6397878 [Phlegmacium glaucopus]